MLIDRRGFLGHSAAIGAATLFGVRFRAPVHLYINHASGGPGTSVAMRRGLQMGVEEAQRAAALFQGAVVIRDPGLGDDVIPERDVVTVWVVESGATHRDSVIALARRLGHVVFNTDDASDAFRSKCVREVFHLAPSGTNALAWTPELTRFGADSLNKRFRARHGEEMTAPSWCGWFAAKCAWEATLRSGARSSSEVVTYLEQSASRFDGHKGVPLFFDATHQLVQPTYNEKSEEMPAQPNPVRCDWKS